MTQITSSTLLNSVKYVAENSENVSINTTAIDKYTKDFEPINLVHWSKTAPFAYANLSNPYDELDFRFLVDTQAFYFWGYPSKWHVDYQSQKLDGWWALIACFKRALNKGIPILEGAYLADLNYSQAKHLFHGTPPIPLLKDRVKILNQIGQTLVNKYQGRFHNFYQHAPKDALALLSAIVTNFAGFDDVSLYKGETIYFYKKAQLLVADLAFDMPSDSDLPVITGLDQLTGKADYKIPQVLRRLGILRYSSKLAAMVDSRLEIAQHSEFEVEIRANMLWATHLISQRLIQTYPDLHPVKVDYILWNLSQNKYPEDKPYHLTKTIYY